MNAFRFLALSLVVLLTAATALAQNINNTGSFVNTGTASYLNFTNGATGSVDNTGTLRIRGVLTNSAVADSFRTETGSVNYYGAGNGQTVIGTIKNSRYGNLEATRGGTKSLNANVSVGTRVNLDNAATILAVGTNTLTLAGTDTVVKMLSGSTISSAATGTIQYTGGSALVAAGFDYGNLVFSTAAGTRTFQTGTTGIAGSFTISAGTADARSNTTTIDYKGTDQAVAAMDYNSLTFSNAGTKTFASGTTGINGTFTIGGTAVADARTNSSAIEYDGAAQSVQPLDYYDLTLAGSGAKTFANDTTRVSSAFAMGGTATADLTTNTSTFEYDGAAQSVLGGLTYYDFITSGSGTKTLTTGTLTVNGNFDNGGAGNDPVTLDIGTYTFAPAGADTNTAGATIQFGGAANGLAISTGTVEYNATGLAQTVAAGMYEKVTFSGGGAGNAKTISSSMLTTDIVSVLADAKLIVSANPVRFGVSMSSGNSLSNLGILEVQATGNLAITMDVANSGTITNAGTITVGTE